MTYFNRPVSWRAHHCITIIVLVSARRAAVRPRLAVRLCLHGVFVAFCRRRQTEVQVQFRYTGVEMLQQTLLNGRVQSGHRGARRQSQVGRL